MGKLFFAVAVVVVVIIGEAFGVAYRMPTDREAKVAVERYYRTYAYNPASVKFKDWKFIAYPKRHGYPLKAVKVMVLSQNGFGGMTGWQTKYFISSCPNRCVAQPLK